VWTSDSLDGQTSGMLLQWLPPLAGNLHCK